MSGKRRTLLLTVVMLVLAMIYLQLSTAPLQNYTDPFEPLFEVSYARPAPTSTERLKVVSWNLGFAEDVEEAVRTLRRVEPLQDADVLLLQEMDEDGVDIIAQSLNYNYVYYPASVHRKHNKNFGNAILSRWPLKKPEKIILPTTGPGNKHTRIAVRAETSINDHDILLYSVHLETFWIWQAEDERQATYLAQQIGGQATAVVGGDFNTLTRGSIIYLEDLLAQFGFFRTSAGTGYTFLLGPLPLTLDHIFSRGLPIGDAGVWRQSTASDHYPIWADFELGETEE